MKYEINPFRRLALCAAPLILICSATVTPARAQDAVAAQTQTPTDQQLSEGQIEQLEAPIALYPDPLLSQVLMARLQELEERLLRSAAKPDRPRPPQRGQRPNRRVGRPEAGEAGAAVGAAPGNTGERPQRVNGHASCW